MQDTLPPAHTHTYINTHTHSLPCPLRNTGRGGCVGGFPQLFKQIPTDGRGTFLLGSRCSLSQLPVSFTNWPEYSFIYLPFPPQKTFLNCCNKQLLFPWKTVFKEPNWNLRGFPRPLKPFIISCHLSSPRTRLVRPSFFSSDPETFCPPQPSSTVWSDIQLFDSARTLERIMPSDFLTPFLELDEEFCKVRATNDKV